VFNPRPSGLGYEILWRIDLTHPRHTITVTRIDLMKLIPTIAIIGISRCVRRG
jgi:hypothetical protein